MTTTEPVEPTYYIAPVADVAPTCVHCGRLVWWMPTDQLTDSRGRARCPAVPWWQRLFIFGPHALEPGEALDADRLASRLVLAGVGLFVAAALTREPVAVLVAAVIIAYVAAMRRIPR